METEIDTMSGPPSYQEQLDYLNYCLRDYIDKANSKDSTTEDKMAYRGLIDMTQALIASVMDARRKAYCRNHPGGDWVEATGGYSLQNEAQLVSDQDIDELIRKERDDDDGN